MRRIAPETERLMWLVAESHDPKAAAEFEARFPELRAQLASRMAMVDSLKKGQRVRVPEIPRFTPRTVAVGPRFSRPMMIAMAGLAGAVAFGSYAITVTLQRVSPQIKTPPIVQHVNLQEPILPRILPHEDVPVHTDGPNKPDVVVTTDNSSQPTAQEDPLQHLITLKVESAPLQAALVMVCNSAHLKAEFAPNMPRVDVRLDYAGIPAAQVLEDLGAQYGFTALPQGKGQVLIVPARPADENLWPTDESGLIRKIRDVPH